MVKSIKGTMVFLLCIFSYVLLSDFYLRTNVSELYIYIINPAFWFLSSLILAFICEDNHKNNRVSKNILQYTLIGSISFIIVYMLIGLVVSFGKNPYDTSFRGIIVNFWSIGMVLICQEFIRYKLINNVQKKYKSIVAVAISIIYLIIAVDLVTNFRAGLSVAGVIKLFATVFLPGIAINYLLSVMAIKCSLGSQIIYQLLTNGFFWISPIVPNSPWIINSLINISIPVFIILYINFYDSKYSVNRNKKRIKDSNPYGFIPLIVMIILVIWFATGVFPIKPVSIATGSMEKVLYVGDIAIIKKCEASEVEINDIIEYQMEGYTVIHRVIEKKFDKNGVYFICKGDNNGTPDSKKVREDQIIGRMIFKVKYLGYPAIWMNSLKKNNVNVQVET